MRTAILGAAIVAVVIGGYLLLRGDDNGPAPPAPAAGPADEPSTERPRAYSTRAVPTLPSAPEPSKAPDFRRMPGGDNADVRDRRAQRRANRILQFDTNGDGQIDADERAALRDERGARRRSRALQTFDSDGDGKLDEDERTVRDWARADRVAHRTEQIIREGDTDGDGKISASEAEAGGRRLRRITREFDEFDLDGDGFVTKEEIGKTYAARRERRERRERGGKDVNEE